MESIEDIVKQVKKNNCSQTFDDVMSKMSLLAKIYTHKDFVESKHKKYIVEVESIYSAKLTEYISKNYADECLILGLFLNNTSIADAKSEIKKYNINPTCVKSVPRNSIIYQTLTDAQYCDLLNYACLLQDILS